MHAILHALPAVLVLGAFIGIILKLHAADVRSTDTPQVQVCHKTCAYVNLLNGQERTVEPGFVEFAIEGVFNKLAGGDMPTRLHLKPEPV